MSGDIQTIPNRLYNALESIGVNLDETDIEALEWIVAEYGATHNERGWLRDHINKAIGDAGADMRETEQKEAIDLLTAAGFVLNDDDGETWTRGTEVVRVELVNGREARYKWEYETLSPELSSGVSRVTNISSGVSGEFHRLMALINPKDSGVACGGAPPSPLANTDGSNG